MRALRVLVVFDIASKIGGGSQGVAFTWIRNLKQLGVQVKLLTNDAAIAQQQGLTTDEIIVAPPINLGFIYPDFSLPMVLSDQTKREMAAFNPDIIHLHEPSLVAYHVLLFSKKSTSFLKPPVSVFSYHTNYQLSRASTFPSSVLWNPTYGPMNRIVTALQTFLFAKSDYVTTATKYYQEQISTRMKTKVVYVPYPIQSLFFERQTKTSKVPKKLIVVSRLSAEKKVSMLIDMMSYLKDLCTLTIVGKGVDEQLLKTKTETLGLSQQIQFVTTIQRQEIPKLLHEHDLYVYPSNFETFGMTYIETLATGTPAVVYDYPITREIVPNNTSVFVSDLDPKTWAHAIRSLHEHPDRYRSMIEAITTEYRSIEKFREEESAKKLLEMYERVVTK